MTLLYQHCICFRIVLLSSMNYCAVDPMDYIDYIYIEYTMSAYFTLCIVPVIYNMAYVSQITSIIMYFDKGL